MTEHAEHSSFIKEPAAPKAPAVKGK